MRAKSWVLFVATLLTTGWAIIAYLASESPDSAAEVQELIRREQLIDSGQPRSSALHKVASTDSQPMLDPDQQKLIWNLEHYTFELEWKFGSKIKEAIRTKDRSKLLSCFLPESHGSVPAWEGERFDTGSWWRQHELDGKSTQQPTSASGVADFLIDAVSDFSEIKKVKLRVLQIHADPEVVDQYRLEILLTATGTDQTGGPASLSSHHQLLVRFANDEAIIDAKIIKNWTVNSLVTRGANETFFPDVTEAFQLDKLDLPDNWQCAPGIQIDTYTHQMAVADFDRDGYLDIAISSLQGKQYLLRSVDGVTFEDMTERLGLPGSKFFSYTTIATWIDYDNDEYPDLLLGRNMYHNEQGKRFRRVTSGCGLKFDAPTMGALVVDYDCDGWLDLYVLNHLGDRGDQKFGFAEDDTVSGVKNQLWRNLGNGTFQDVTANAGVDGAARHSFAATWFFANDDHYPDMYLVNDFGRNCLFINRGDGTFEDVTTQAGVGDFANSMGVAAGDLDNDGSSEIYVANMFSKMGRRIIAHVRASDYPEGVYRGIEGACAGSHLYKKRSDHGKLVYDEISVEKSVNEIGWAYAPVFADFDADGLLDIYATSGFISVDRAKPDG